MTGRCDFVESTGDAPCGRAAAHAPGARPLCDEHLAVVEEGRRAKAACGDTYDPCPEGHPGVTDIGHGVRIRYTTYRGVTAGLIESHPRPDNGERCSGAITFDLVETIGLDRNPRWSVISRDPLTLSPSLQCRTCGHHGFITNGRWIPA